jgi:N-acetyl-beta-hexosaminidase
MSDSMLFRKYAREAMAGSQASRDENEKRLLGDRAVMWLKAATASETFVHFVGSGQ